MPLSLYRYVWLVSHRRQIVLCSATVVVALIAMVPLEIQRRIVDHAIAEARLSYLLLLCGAYLGVILVQGGIKYFLNIYRGRTVEEVARALRLTIYARTRSRATDDAEVSAHAATEQGTVVAMVAAEVEDLAGFVGDSISAPLLQIGTAATVLGYLFWVEPLIAAFAIIVYLPQLFVVPLGQKRINFWAATHARLIRYLGDLIVAPYGRGTGPGGADQMDRFVGIAKQTFDSRIHVYRIKFFLTFFGNFLDAIGPLAILLIGGLLVIRGHTQMSTLVVFISGFQRVADPWDQLTAFYRTLSNARVKYRLIVDALAPAS
jgi:ABC-type multidrug transport system fused ATPase/permease subunit